MLRRLVCACLCAWFAGVADDVNAAAMKSLSAHPAVSFEQCSSLDESATRKLLALELRGVAEATTAQVRVRCQEPQVFLNVAWGERQSSRALDLGATQARAWPRIVALAVVELLTEPLIPPTPQAGPADTASAQTTAVAARAERSAASTAYDVGALARTLPSLRSTLFGLGAGVIVLQRTPTLIGRVGFRLAASVEHAAQTLDVGDGVINAGSLFLGGVTASGHAWAPWLGAGLRGGMAWLRGEPSPAAKSTPFSAPWLGPELSVGVSYIARSGLGVAARIDGGYAVVAAVGRGVAEGSERFGYSGAWLALNLSVALQK